MEGKLALKGFLAVFMLVAALMTGLGVVSAYDGFGGNPLFDLFYSPTFQVGLIIVLFFALIFFALLKSGFVENRGIAVAVSGVLSFLIVAAFWREGYINRFGGVLGSWFLVLGFLVLLFFVLRFLSKRIGAWSVIVIVFIGWLVIKGIDPYFVDMFSGFPNAFFVFWESMQGVWGFVGVVIISLIILSLRYKKVRNALRYDLGRISVGGY